MRKKIALPLLFSDLLVLSDSISNPTVAQPYRRPLVTSTFPWPATKEHRSSLVHSIEL
jgi:hypothetical protein